MLANTTARSKETLTLAALRAMCDAIMEHYWNGPCQPAPLSGRSQRAHVSPVGLPICRSGHLFAGAPQPGLVSMNFDPVTQLGWRGPYVKNGVVSGRFTLQPGLGFSDPLWLTGDPARLTPGDPARPSAARSGLRAASAIDIRYARLVSAGPNGVLDTPPGVLSPAADRFKTT